MNMTKRIQKKHKTAMFGLAVFFCLFMGLLNSPAYSTIVTLYPTIDTFVNSGAPGSSYGTSTDLYVGKIFVSGFFNNVYQSFLKFDLSTIPDGSTITSAELNLYCRQSSFVPNALKYEAYRVADADESTIQNTMTWNSKPSSGMTFLDAINTFSSSLVWKKWDLLSSGNWGYASDLIDNSFSVRLNRTLESTNININATFHSMENTYDPYLEIEYTAIPIPTSIFLLGSGLMGIVGIRKRFKK